MPEGDVPASIAGVLVGRVASKSFLGGTTRLKVAMDSSEELAADVPSARAQAVPVGSRVVLRVAPENPRVLALPGR